MKSPVNMKTKLVVGVACVLFAMGTGSYTSVAFAAEQANQIDLGAAISAQIQTTADEVLPDGVDVLDDTEESLPVVGVGSVIEEGGTYQLEPYSSNGTITVATTEAVTIVGSGVSTGKSNYVTIDCTVAGANLTLQDVRIDNADDKNYSAVRFTGTGNVLTIEGENSLQQCYNNDGDLAIIYVPQDGSLTIQGTGTLYMYKKSYGCSAIGADSDGPCGDITISGSTIRILAMNGGAAIGGDPSGSISITGGDIAIYTRTGSTGILGSAVNIAGGTVSLDANASNAGCIYCDELDVTGGNLRVDSSLISVSSDMKQVRYDLDLSEIEGFDGSCEVLVDGTVYYSGELTQCAFSSSAISQGDWSSVASNWIVSSADSLALYLTPQDHEVTVNGTTLYLEYSESGFTLLDEADGGDDSGEGDGEGESENPDEGDSEGEGENPDEGESTDENEEPDGDSGEGESSDSDEGDSDDEGTGSDVSDESSGSSGSGASDESSGSDGSGTSDEDNGSSESDGSAENGVEDGSDTFDTEDSGDDNGSVKSAVDGGDASSSGDNGDDEATSDDDSQKEILPATGDDLTPVAAVVVLGMSAAAAIALLAAHKRSSL